MFLLAFHIVAIGILIALVWFAAYQQGRRAGERRLRRQLGMGAEDGAPAHSSPRHDRT